MPVVNREVVLPVPRERAWELVTEPEELETWLAEDVEFEPEEGAPLRTEAASPRGRRRARQPRSGSSSPGATRSSSGGSRTIPAARASSSPSTASPTTRRLGPEAQALAARLPAVPGVDDRGVRRPGGPDAPPGRARAVAAAGADRLAPGRRAADDPPGRDQAPGRAGPRRAGRAPPRGPRDPLHAHPRAARRRDGLDGRGRRAVGRPARPAGGARRGKVRRHARRARHRRGRRDRPRRRRAADRRRLDVLVRRPQGATARHAFEADLTTREGNKGAVSRRAGGVRPARRRRRQRRRPARRAGRGVPRGQVGRADRAPAHEPVPARQVRLGRRCGVRRAGRYIAIASAHALAASPYKAAYVSAKHGVLGLVQDARARGRRRRHLRHRRLPRLRPHAARREPDPRPGQGARHLRGGGARAGHPRAARDQAADRARGGRGRRRVPGGRRRGARSPASR